MSLPITVEQMYTRLFNFPHDRYLYVGSIMKGIALAAASYVLLKIFIDFRRNWTQLLPWVASLLATLLTLMTWGRGILFTNSHANLWDSIFPMLMGIVEFGLFAILSPDEQNNNTQGNIQNKLNPWRYWFILLSIHTLLGFLLVRNRISTTDRVGDFEPNLQPLVEKYFSWMEKDLSGAFYGFIMFFLIGIILIVVAKYASKYIDDYFLKGILNKIWKKATRRDAFGIIYAVFCLLPIFIFWSVINEAEIQRQETDKFVSDKMKEAKTDAVNTKSP